MITHSGQKVFPDDLNSPRLFDIGMGLAVMPRFAGQTASFYTVLWHTITVAALVSDDSVVHALLHDAPEAIVGDVPSTWKTVEHEIREAMILDSIYEGLNLDHPTDDQYDDVKRADAIALAAEAHVLGHAAAQQYWPIDDCLDRWGDDFNKARQLTGKNKNYVMPSLEDRRYTAHTFVGRVLEYVEDVTVAGAAL